jgi:hypothetical protein
MNPEVFSASRNKFPPPKNKHIGSLDQRHQHGDSNGKRHANRQSPVSFR